MEKQEFQAIAIQFSDLADCTEYFYNELGKLDSVSIGKREYKKLKKIIMKNFFASLAILKQRQSLQTEVDKFAIDTYKAGLAKAKQELHPSMLSKVKTALKKTENEPEKLTLDEPKQVELWTPPAEDDTQTE